MSNLVPSDNSGQNNLSPTTKRRSSRAVRERKKIQRRIKYNVIGKAKQQARIAAVNLVHIDGEDVDMSDAFQFMDWYLAHVETIANDDNMPIPESIMFEFEDKLLALDLCTDASRQEKVAFLCDIVRAPELRNIIEKQKEEQGIDALDEIPLIDLSEDAQTTSGDSQDVEELIEQAGTIAIVQECETDPNPMGFVRTTMEHGFVPLLMHEEVCRQQFDLPVEERYSNVAYYVANWKLEDFRRLMVSDDRYYEWLYQMKDDRSARLNVRVCTAQGYTQHHFKHLYIQSSDVGFVTSRCEARGLMGISKGIGVITNGMHGCRLTWV